MYSVIVSIKLWNVSYGTYRIKSSLYLSSEIVNKCIFVIEIVCPLIEVTNANPPTGTCTKPDLSYLTTCTFKCWSGYILQGNPVRQCQQDKTWSGTINTCERKLVPAKSKRELPVSWSLIAEILCTFKIALFLTDLFGICFAAVMCPKLNSISLSQVTPPECVTQESRFDTRCVFECPKGYLFKGTIDKSTLRFCQKDGTWTGEHKPCAGK